MTVVAGSVSEGEAPVAALGALLDRHAVVILGEDHHRPESARFTAEVASHYLEGGGCIAVALEIESDQQAVLDAAMRGKEPIATVWVHSIVDHPGYRDMLRGSGISPEPGSASTCAP
jgi:hypothetical protein